jgi:hypothetical protein
MLPPPDGDHVEKIFQHTVASFEKCLHHAMELSMSVMHQLAPVASATTASPLPLNAVLSSGTGSTSPAATCSFCSNCSTKSSNLGNSSNDRLVKELDKLAAQIAENGKIQTRIVKRLHERDQERMKMYQQAEYMNDEAYSLLLSKYK